MNKQKTIIDTSIWIEYFKNTPDITAFIDDGLDKGLIYISGPIISELLQGVKSLKELDMLGMYIDAVPCLNPDTSDWIDAGRLSYSLRKKGLTIPLTDMIIAVVAKRNKVAVYSLDMHFSSIPQIDIIRTPNI